MVAEFEANLGHLRTREGMALAKKNGKLKGKHPKLPEPARHSIRRRYAARRTSATMASGASSATSRRERRSVSGSMSNRWAAPAAVSR